MAMTFDATLKDMGRSSPDGFLTRFDRSPPGPLKLLNVDLEDGLASVAERMVDRIKGAPMDRQKKLLTDAYLLSGLRVRRDVAKKIFRGVWAMHDSDTFLAILEEGEEKGQVKATRKLLLVVGEERLGMPDQSIQEQLNSITDLDCLTRMHRRTVKASSWQEIIDSK